jgi:hypothetical protein
MILYHRLFGTLSLYFCKQGMSEIQCYRIALDSNPEGRYRWIACGDLAHFLLKCISSPEVKLSMVSQDNYYCEACSSRAMQLFANNWLKID